jgi:CHAP domain-containing protein
MTPHGWARDILKRVGFPVTTNNMTSVLAWEYAEGGHFHNAARFNPLNTTMAHATYGSINGVGVATYPDYETGMRETIATLKLPAYAKIRADLNASAPPATTAAAISASPWGTWHGTSPDAVVARAWHEVHAHPSWVHAPSTPGASLHPAGGRPRKVVLDLAELHRLSRTYQHASDRVLHARRAVQDIAVDLEAARQALPDPAVANAIAATFAFVTDPQYGLDRDARRMDELSAYLAEVRRLAQEADANHDGKWTKAEAKAFLHKHPHPKDDPAVRAVAEALAGGHIYRSAKDMVPPRQAKIDKLLALAAKQHASEHDGDNVTKYNIWFGDPGQQWCGAFVSWVYFHAGHPLPAIQGPKGFVYCPYAITYAKEHHELHAVPKPGDIFLYKDGSHTGIVSKVYADGHFDTVEGNWGNKVSHVHRYAKDGTYYFWRPIE